MPRIFLYSVQNKPQRYTDSSGNENGRYFVSQIYRLLIIDRMQGFPSRDNKEHRQHSDEYSKIDEDNKKARDAFASKHGIMKTQWLDAWIRDPAALRKRTEKTSRELDQIYEYLKAVFFSLEMPAWVARLPNQVGYASGGNLTSDEWKGMLLVVCPLIVSRISP
ncbi:hypothetical protein R3P38DRAFT_2772352 [Favolaschia claudopus]|uniref:Uncharacterized protein n=1 Tax=Favolaschia claudopus TaxID=2862362 RepID=A0AAW0C4W5_9AGAR